MEAIKVLDRSSGKVEEEKVYGEKAVAFLYGKSWSARLVRPLLTHLPFFSALYGWLQARPYSAKKVAPFIAKFGVDTTEFEKQEFASFNDFFIRRLKKAARPIAAGDNILSAPADGRYWFCPEVTHADGFLIKGERYSIEKLVGGDLAKRYENGALVKARLCPTDYHRFHFPCGGIPDEARLVNGYLHSVNPHALRQNIHIFTENKRMVTLLDSPQFGQVAIVEVGAVCVGTIHQTFKPGCPVQKGDEKGYFSFGGSSMILLFEPGKVTFDADLLTASSRYQEIKCLMGERIGLSTLIESLDDSPS